MRFFTKDNGLINKFIPMIVIIFILLIIGYVYIENPPIDLAGNIIGICIYVLAAVSFYMFFLIYYKKSTRNELDFKNAVGTANIIILSFSEQGMILNFNHNAETIFGCEADKVINKSDVYSIFDAKSQRSLKKYFRDIKSGIMVRNFELSAISPDGEQKHIIFNLNVLDLDEVNKEYELMGIDITDRVRAELELIEKHEELSEVYEELAASEEELREQLDELNNQKKKIQETDEKIKKLAYFDSLTGLPNLSMMNEKFNELSQKINGDIVLIYIDLDSFKLINNSYGHIIGDKILIATANRLMDCCTDKMFLFRAGADEYAVLAWDYGSEEALKEFVGNLVNIIGSPLKMDDCNINLSVNIGIASYPKNASNFDELLKNADTALYNAIVNRCKYLYYNDGMNYAIMERMQLMSGLKTAMDNSEFLLYYQPQYRSKDKKIVGFEALVRWNSGKFGMISPAKFIPLAEESMLIIHLGNWILEEAVKFLKYLHTEGYEDLIISVNISVIQLIQQNFAESVLGIINAYDIPPQCVELEITESAAIESADIVLENMKLLKSKGVRFALDDFGTGYSSLNYVTSLPINTLKIDKAFIDSIGKAKDIGFLTGYIIEIGRKLGLSVVAEGVETEIQFKYLEKKHCERIQGFLLSKPVSADKAKELLIQEYAISDSLFTG